MMKVSIISSELMTSTYRSAAEETAHIQTFGRCAEGYLPELLNVNC